MSGPSLPRLLWLLVLGGPAPALVAQPRHEYAALHMGVETRIVMYAPGDRAPAAARAAFARIAALEDVMSDWRPESEVRRLERRPGAWVPVSAALFDVLDRAVRIARATDGAFDPTVGPVIALWRDARSRGRLPDPSALASARALVDWRAIGLDHRRRRVRLAHAGMRIDLGGIAKGWILQAALSTLAARGVRRALLEAGGDIVVGDAPPGSRGWRIETPDADSVLAARAAALERAAVSTSGPAAQSVDINGVRYSHVVDPHTGVALTTGTTATVIADDGATADALSTALTVMTPDRVPAVLARFPAVTASVGEGTTSLPCGAATCR